MLRKSNNSQPVSKNEELALTYEARKDAAEKEFLIICQDKKRVLENKEILEKEIDKIKEQINKSIITLENTKKSILDLEEEYSLEKNKVNDILLEKEKIQTEFNQFVSKTEIEKKSLSNDVYSVKKLLKDQKDELNKELLILDTNKKDLLNQIKKLQSEIDVLVFNKEKEFENLSDIKKYNEEENNKISYLKLEIDRLEKYKQDQDIFISSKNETINQLDTKIESLKNDISKLEESLVKKTNEYKELESLAFSILQKQEIVNQKEAFIRSRYERSGIKYD